MQHGENGAAVPRRIANAWCSAMARPGGDRQIRKPQPDDRFVYGIPVDMRNVIVTRKRPRQFKE